MQSNAKSVEEYLSQIALDRREEISNLRQLILDNIKKGFVEVMQYGMISYVVPLTKYPKTYNEKPLSYISLASQKNYISLYLTNVYVDQPTNKWFH